MKHEPSLYLLCFVKIRTSKLLSYQEHTGALKYVFISKGYPHCGWCFSTAADASLCSCIKGEAVICSRLQHPSKSKQGSCTDFVFHTHYCTASVLSLHTRNKDFFFRSIAITGPQCQNWMIDSNSKNTLEHPTSLHTMLI